MSVVNCVYMYMWEWEKEIEKMRKIEREWKRGKRWKGEVWGRFVVMATDQYTTDDIYYIQLLNTYFIDFLFTLQYTDCKTELINILREKKFNDKYTCRCYKWLTTPHAVFVLFPKISLEMISISNALQVIIFGVD